MRGRLVKVHLYGPLADRFGAEHEFAVLTPREAIRALDANYPGFLAAFTQHEQYAIVADGDHRPGDTAPDLPFGRDVHFVPIIEGQGPLVPILVGVLAPVIGTTAATIVSGLLITGLMIGISMLFQPKMDKPEAEEKDEGFAFTGPENVTGQGVAIPLIYGRVYAGSVVVSAGQSVDDLSITPPNKGSPKPPTGNENKPKKPGGSSGSVGEDVAPPVKWTPGGHTRAAREDIGVSDSMMWEGAGTEHLRDDPPPDGWPVVVTDPIYGWRPQGWVPARMTWVNEEDSENRKQVMVFQPDYDTDDNVSYNWNMVAGYYVTGMEYQASYGNAEDEWIDGSLMETEIPEPAA